MELNILGQFDINLFDSSDSSSDEENHIVIIREKRYVRDMINPFISIQRNTKEMGISILKKTIALKLRNKKLKKMYEVIPHETSKRDRDMKKEVHKTRMKILKKKLELKENQFFAELKINVERLKAVKVKNEIRVLQKQIKEAKLEKLLKD